MQPQANAFQPQNLGWNIPEPLSITRLGLQVRRGTPGTGGCSTIRTGRTSPAAAAAEPGKSQLRDSVFLLEELVADFAGACKCHKGGTQRLAGGDDGW